MLVRSFNRRNKLDSFWLEATIQQRVGQLQYTLVDQRGKCALKDLKSLHPTEIRLPDQIPQDEKGASGD